MTDLGPTHPPRLRPPHLVVHGANIVDPAGTHRDRWVAVDGPRVVAVGSGQHWRELADDRTTTVIDADGGFLTPGLIDLHAHGGSRHRYDDGADSIRAALRCHRAHGTTRSVVSLVTNPIDDMCRALRAVSEIMRGDPTVLGAHAEGPFLSSARRGAHAKAHLVPPTEDRVSRLIDAASGDLRHVTIAPELVGATAAIRQLLAAGVVVAIGHTDADVDAARRAFDLGATVLTHAYNGMAPPHHRAPGPAIAALNDPRVALELIVDGHHVHPELVQTTFVAAPSRVILITDAMSAACCGDGSYRLGEVDVEVVDGRATVVGTDGLAGSSITQDVAVRTAIRRCGVEPHRAIEAASASPARVLGLDHRFGRLEPGFEADLVLFDQGWNVTAVWISGSRVEGCQA